MKQTIVNNNFKYINHLGQDKAHDSYTMDIYQGDTSDLQFMNSCSFDKDSWLPTGSICYIASNGKAVPGIPENQSFGSTLPFIVKVGTDKASVRSEKYNAAGGLVTILPLNGPFRLITTVFDRSITTYQTGDMLTVKQFTFAGKQVYGVSKVTDYTAGDVIVGIVDGPVGNDVKGNPAIKFTACYKKDIAQAGGSNFYKCSATDAQTRTWAGYLYNAADNTFAATATTNLHYTTPLPPSINSVYSEDASVCINISKTQTAKVSVPLKEMAAKDECGNNISTGGSPTYGVYKGIPSARLGGESDYLRVGRAHLPSGTPVSLSLWILVVSFENDLDNVVAWGDSNVRCRPSVDIVDHELQMDFHGGNIVTGYMLEEDVWYHIAITIDTDTIKFYVNGELIHEIMQSIEPGFSNIGICDNPVDGSATAGIARLAAVRLYDKILSEDDVVSLSKEFTPTA